MAENESRGSEITNFKQDGGTIVRAPNPPKPPDVQIVNGRLAPQSFEQMWRVATAFHAAGMLPAGVKTAAQTMVVLFAGASVGMDPVQSLQNIMVVNNRPTIFGDAMLAVCEATGLLADIEETIEGTGDDRVAVCKITKKGRQTPIVRRFSVADAKRAGLWGKSGPWTNYPDRMQMFRARSWACRDAFPGAVKGLRTPDEEEEVRAEGLAVRADESRALIEAAEPSEFDPGQMAPQEPVEAPSGGITAEPAKPRETWPDAKGKNQAAQPGHHRRKLVESAGKAVEGGGFDDLTAEDLVRRLEDAFGLPRPGSGVSEGDATRAYADAVKKAEAPEFWRQFGPLDVADTLAFGGGQ